MKKTILLSLLLGFSGAFGLTGAALAEDSVAATQVAMMQVNINQADVETMSRELQGIGPSKAQAIVDYRNAHGAFQSVDELLEVKGIGVAILERLRSQLVVE